LKRALITGITGQDGSYLAELLLNKGYEVHGVIRRSSSFNTGRIMHIFQDPHEQEVQLKLHYGDLSDGSTLNRIIRAVKPDELYNLGAQSHVRVSFDLPEYTGDTSGIAVTRILDAIHAIVPECRFYQASTSEMLGAIGGKQVHDEGSELRPRSPYGAAKAYGYWMTVNYRESYNLYAVNGILFNHESPRRGETFVTRKITRAVARILAGKERYVFLGNLDAKRDWGYAKDYVDAMWRMLQQDEPDDYVIATGVAHSVREFAEKAFSYVNLNWEDYVQIDPRYYRPAEIDVLVGDASKAREALGWSPTVSFEELVRLLVDADLEREGVARPS
jgi:GDPmannose 4,6-dehydratase